MSRVHRIFVYTALISLAGNLGILLEQAFFPIPGLVWVLLALCAKDLVALGLFFRGKVEPAYHVFVLLSLLIYGGANPFIGTPSLATILLYPLLSLLGIFFFSTRWVTLLYAVLGLFGAVSTLLAMAWRFQFPNMDWIIEAVVVGAFFTVFYLVSEGLVNGLKQSRDELLVKESELRAKQEKIEAKNQELQERNDALKEAEVVLSAQNEELERYIESNTQLQNFAYVASHDLQAPLTSIIAFSDLLRNTADLKLDPTEKRFLESIETSASNMKNLVVALLEFSRIDGEALALESVEPKKLVEEVLGDISFSLEEKEAEVSVDGNWPSQIQADPVKLRQVFQNLIQNGAKFSRKGIRPKIVVSARENLDDWTFAVADNGVGIPEEGKDKIFQMFKRLHSGSEYPGTGIGLALVQKMVDQHGGKIWLESEVGKGTTFYLSLPQQKATENQDLS